MIEVGLFDGSFPNSYSATYGGENREKKPKHIRWLRDRIMPVTFYTDMCLEKAALHPPDIRKIAWLIEPYVINYYAYERVVELQDTFDAILTFDSEFTERYVTEKWYYYALGGSWIDEKNWGMHTKSKGVSLIGTDKHKAPGHGLRHACAALDKLFPIDVMGRGYKPIPTKTIALADYRYSIVVENDRTPGYFSEKLIDCISQGTVPIYWGDYYFIESIFDIDGFIPFDDTDDLIYILVNIANESDYEKRKPALERNMGKIAQFTCVEDWLFLTYPNLFKKGIGDGR